MSRIYYAVRYHLDNQDRYLLWHSNDADGIKEADGVALTQEGNIPVFRTQQSLLDYAQSKRLLLVQESPPDFINLDVVKTWLKRKRPAQLDCIAFLSAWNLFADISMSIGGSFDPNKDNTRKIYSKLFWGNNLPAVTPVGRHYEPLWSGLESRIIRQVLSEGLLLFLTQQEQHHPQQ